LLLKWYAPSNSTRDFIYIYGVDINHHTIFMATHIWKLGLDGIEPTNNYLEPTNKRPENRSFSPWQPLVEPFQNGAPERSYNIRMGTKTTDFGVLGIDPHPHVWLQQADMRPVRLVNRVFQPLALNHPITRISTG
jgi:hypothetical protein